MFAGAVPSVRKVRDEAEKPFWISYADLMTALMVLFLVSMLAVMITVTEKVDKVEQRKKAHEQDIAEFIKELERLTVDVPGVKVNRDRNVVEFDRRAYFGFDSSVLNPEAEEMLRAYVPKVLALAETDRGKRVLKRIVVEGFTDDRGTYLYNLNLSLQRSQRMLCALLAPAGAMANELSSIEKEQVQRLFLVGGYSSNSARDTPDESRRIELRMEIYTAEEAPKRQSPKELQEIGRCAAR